MFLTGIGGIFSMAGALSLFIGGGRWVFYTANGNPYNEPISFWTIPIGLGCFAVTFLVWTYNEDI